VNLLTVTGQTPEEIREEKEELKKMLVRKVLQAV